MYAFDFLICRINPKVSYTIYSNIWAMFRVCLRVDPLVSPWCLFYNLRPIFVFELILSCHALGIGGKNDQYILQNGRWFQRMRAVLSIANGGLL